ncbi:hypothetical protein ABIE65_002943 [Constrictibacter sp. MBR-5]|jgi:hypothetical protein|uniref:hypothetical protein n=1 Tax=Constrictibacter sp. MBR-5 TaxID=3156467 RepID=UPI0033986D82
MSGTPFLPVILGLAILNGIFSPFLVFTARLILLHLAPALLFLGPVTVAFFASLLAATAALVLAGVPAALFERVTGRRQTDAASAAVWLVSLGVISFPALRQAGALLF